MRMFCVCVTSSDSRCIRYLFLHNKSPPKLSSLERPAFIISWFLWVRNPGMAGLGPWGSRSPTGCHQGVYWGYSQLKALLWERSTSELTLVALARFSSSWAVGLKSSAPRWMLAGGCSQVLAIIELEIYSQNGSLLPGQASE